MWSTAAAATSIAFRLAVREPISGGGGPRTGIRAATLHRPPVGLLRSNASRLRSRACTEGARWAIIWLAGYFIVASSISKRACRANRRVVGSDSYVIDQRR
jgi:hypothetical protein